MESGRPALLPPPLGDRGCLIGLGDLTSSLSIFCGRTSFCAMNELPAQLDFRP